MEHRRSAFSRWASGGAWAVADQGFFSASNFLLTVLLARWLSPEDFGAFSVAFSVFVIVSTVHTAVLTEAVLVYGPLRTGARFSAYLGSVMGFHWVVAAATAAALFVFAGAALATGHRPVSWALVWMAGAAPFVLQVWLLRRVFYVMLRPGAAAAAGALNFVLFLTALLLLRSLGILSTATGIGAIGCASAVTAAVLMARVPRAEPGSRLPLRAVAREHASYGRWAVGNATLVALPGTVFVLVASASHGLAVSGSLRALMNLITPAQQAGAALATLLLPQLVQARPKEFRRLVKLALLALAAGTLSYWLVLSYFGRTVDSLLYAGRYAQHMHLLWVVGLVPVASSIEHVLSVAHKAIGRVDRVFWAWLLATLAAVPAGSGATVAFGVSGATGATLGGFAAAAIMVALSFIRVQRRAATSRPPAFGATGMNATGAPAE